MSIKDEVQKVETEYSNFVQLIRDNPKRSIGVAVGVGYVLFPVSVLLVKLAIAVIF